MNETTTMVVVFSLIGGTTLVLIFIGMKVLRYLKEERTDIQQHNLQHKKLKVSPLNVSLYSQLTDVKIPLNFQEVCSVCLDPFKFESIVKKTACNHYFHQNCIKEWVQKHETCPNCRIDLHNKNGQSQLQSLVL